MAKLLEVSGLLNLNSGLSLSLGHVKSLDVVDNTISPIVDDESKLIVLE